MSRTKQHARKRTSSLMKRKSTETSGDQIPAKRQKAEASQSEAIDNEFDANTAAMDPQLLADHFAKIAKAHLRNETAIELDDQYIPSKAFLNTTSLTERHSLAHLQAFLDKYAGGKENLTGSVETASPHTLFVCPSGIRAADCVRALRLYQTEDSTVAKLFAKHLKLKDAIEFVKKTKFGIGVGTPTRLKDLLDSGEMKTGGLKRIVIDGSYLDGKKRTIFSMKYLFLPMLDLLNQPGIRERYGDDERSIEVLVF